MTGLCDSIVPARAVLVSCVLAALLFLPQRAAAHLLPKQNATLHVVGDKGYLVVSVPASALVGVDTDGDGLLSPREVDAHRGSIARQFVAGFHVRSNAGDARIVFAWVLGNGATVDSSPRERSVHDPASYVIVLAGAQFNGPPGAITVSTSLFGHAPEDRMLTLRVRKGNQVALAVLTPDKPQQQLFNGWFATLVTFVRVGVEHILFGYDHLLFLLTILIAGAGPRYWLSLITSFTVAHSITLTLALLGKVRVDPAIVEPGIALTIVAVALYNLSGRSGKLSPRIAMVFGCGLIHGLGFAGSLDTIGLQGASRLPTLIGFNLGVEIGQLIFVSTLLVAMRVIPLFRTAGRSSSVARPVSAVAAIGGVILFFDRIIPAIAAIA